MKTQNRWLMIAAAMMVIGFTGCNNDENESPEDAQKIINADGNDRIRIFKLFGEVKSMVKARYDNAAYENGAVNKGDTTDMTVVNFNEPGFISDRYASTNLPSACKWGKDKDDRDIIVVTSRKMMPTDSVTVLRDDRNRPVERVIVSGEYKVIFGGADISYRDASTDTIPMWGGEGTPGDNSFSATFNQLKQKRVITYDDANKKATSVGFLYDPDTEEYAETGKIVFDLDEYGRINPMSFEIFPAEPDSAANVKAKAGVNDVPFDGKSVIQYDGQGNRTTLYSLDSDISGYDVENYTEFSYTYY